MSPVDGIRKLGFRRWYERQLIEGHAYLVTCFLCMIVVAALLEGFSFRGEGFQPLVKLSFMFASGIVGIVSVSRYGKVLNRAEHIAEHSTCTSCSTYGRLQIVGAGEENHPSADAIAPWMRVQCRKCGHEWLIE